MSWLRAAILLVFCLALQTGLGYLWPEAGTYLDLMLVPVTWYAIAMSQRSAMLVGCTGGLLQDAWLHTGTFGINGFKKTLIGWLLGAVGARFDLNQPPGRFMSGVAVAIADGLLDAGLRRLLAQRVLGLEILPLSVRALTTGLLVVFCYRILESVAGQPAPDRLESGA